MPPLVTRLRHGPALTVVLLLRMLAILPIAFAGSWWLAAVFVVLAAMPDGRLLPDLGDDQARLIAAAGTRFTAAAMACGYLLLAAAVVPVWSALESLGGRAGAYQVPVAVCALDPPDRRPVL